MRLKVIFLVTIFEAICVFANPDPPPPIMTLSTDVFTYLTEFIRPDDMIAFAGTNRCFREIAFIPLKNQIVIWNQIEPKNPNRIVDFFKGTLFRIANVNLFRFMTTFEITSYYMSIVLQSDLENKYEIVDGFLSHCKDIFHMILIWNQLTNKFDLQATNELSYEWDVFIKRMIFVAMRHNDYVLFRWVIRYIDPHSVRWGEHNLLSYAIQLEGYAEQWIPLLMFEYHFCPLNSIEYAFHRKSLGAVASLLTHPDIIHLRFELLKKFLDTIEQHQNTPRIISLLIKSSPNQDQKIEFVLKTLIEQNKDEILKQYLQSIFIINKPSDNTLISLMISILDSIEPPPLHIDELEYIQHQNGYKFLTILFKHSFPSNVEFNLYKRIHPNQERQIELIKTLHEAQQNADKDDQCPRYVWYRHF